MTVGYGSNEILKDLNLSLGGPGLYRFAGSNGSGKSTIVEVLSGFLKPWAGTVEVCSVPATAKEARVLRSVCRANPALYPSMTVRDHLTFAARLRQQSFDNVLDRVEKFGLDSWLDEPASVLSTGNTRKLWILMCTLNDSPVVILDEPFNGLDDRGAEALIEEVDSWRLDRMVILISHAKPPSLDFDHTFVFQKATQESPPMSAQDVAGV